MIIFPWSLCQIEMGLSKENGGSIMQEHSAYGHMSLIVGTVEIYKVGRM